MDGSRVVTKFREHTDNLFYTLFSIKPYHYTLARDWISSFTTPLRSLDALHLAVASASDLTLVTADEKLAKSGGFLSIDVYLVK